MTTVHSIQFLRFIAAYFVVVQHANLSISEHVASTPDWFYYIANGGVSGVHIFFVISGFIMVYTSIERFGDRSYVLDFIRRRFIRIFPIYWALAIINIVFFKTLEFGSSFSAVDAIYSALLFPGYSSNFIFVGWTLSFEIYFYLIFAALIPFVMGSAIAIMSAIFLVLVTLGMIFKPESASLHVFTNSLLLEFMIGGWIAWYITKGPMPPRYIALLALFGGIAGFAATYAIGYERFPSVVSWGLPAALLVFGFSALEKSGNLPVFIVRFSWLGDSSYSLYLVHSVIVSPLALALPGNSVIGIVPPVVWVFLLSVICVVVGIISYQVLEKPLIRFTRRLLHSPQTTRLQAPK